MVKFLEKNISFKPLSIEDLPLTYKWLLSPHVSKWYDNGKQTFADIVKKYSPRIKGQEPTSCFLILYNEIPIGQIQTYKISDYPEYRRAIQIHENAAGVDLFIGEKEYQHKGLGSLIIQKFLKEFVWARLGVESCIIGPDPNNLAAIKAYEKAGFTYMKTVINPKGEKEYLMRKSFV